MSESDAWKARFERERAARKEAERVIEDKSRALYGLNQALIQKARDLEATIEQLKLTQGALIVGERMAALGGLVAGVAHEINTPIGVALTAVTHGQERVATLVERFESGQLTKSELRRISGELQEAAMLGVTNLRRAATLVASFKMVAIDQSSLELRNASIVELLRDVTRSLGPILRAAKAEVVIDGPEDVSLELAAGEFIQIVTNLLQNACVHAFDDTTASRVVTLRIALESQGLLLTCADNGRGMPAEVLARVFDPFFTTRRGSGGSGLGMHIVENLVRVRFQGTIEVASEVGRGTTWTARFPLGTSALRAAD